MKKIIVSALTVLLCALAFVGCTKDATLEKKLVGEWETVNYREHDSTDWNPVSYRQVFVFGRQKGYTYVIDEDKDDKDIVKTTFTYTIEDEILTFNFEDHLGVFKESFVIQSLAAKKMIWKSNIGYKLELRKR